MTNKPSPVSRSVYQKLTKAQKREMLIIEETHGITTDGYSPRHKVLVRLAGMGLVKQGGTGFDNMFTSVKR